MDLGMRSTSSTLKNANRRRFTDEQIKFLEFMFEAQSRPESQIKQQLANELGLEPRQVSIWFQNRRARLKTKQVEREYNKLKASHDALASCFQSLQRENQSLLIQLQKLKNVHAKQDERKNSGLDITESSRKQRLENRCTNSESKEKIGHPLAGYSRKQDTLSNNQDSGNTESTNEEAEILNLTEATDSFTASSDWYSFECNCFLDESSCSSQWWEFLS